jgi:CheY-like chemotaxis protein
MPHYQDPAASTGAAEPALPAAAPACELSGTALVLEDSILIAMETEDLLRELGCARCELASSVRAALAIIEAQAIDFAVLDIDLGDETCERVADRLLERGTPFVFASGYGEAAEIGERFQGIPIVDKPYDGQALLAAVRRLRGL